MKKAGIMTLYYKTYNYGAQLQAYALCRAVSKLGYECEQLAFRWCREQTEQNYQNFSIDVRAFERFSFSIPHSKRVYTPETIAESVEEYDAFLCGSDQIWGVNDSMPIFVLPLISLSFVPEDKLKIAYAASMGGAAISGMRKEAIREAVGKLDAVSVREYESVPFVSELTDKEVKAVVDPVLLISKQEWDELAVAPDIRGDYIFLYYIGPNKKIIEFAENMAESYGCGLINLAYVNGTKAGPKEFVGYIKNAKYVITDSFHATVFSIIYSKQFLTFGVDHIHSEYSKNIRTLDVLESVGLRKRFTYGYDARAEEILTEPVNWLCVNETLETLKRQSTGFLRHALKIEKPRLRLAPVSRCSGCGACAAVCPRRCITLEADQLGFLYPKINGRQCVDCNQCVRVCPVLEGEAEVGYGGAVRAFAVKHSDQNVRGKSSSGGAFYAVASAFMEAGGLVAACRYGENFAVEHRVCEDIGELEAFCGSKYVQSSLGNIVSQIKEVLEQGRNVLFAGTPCQIEGFKNILGEKTENLYTVGLICGGVTSPALWDKYIQYQRSFGNLERVSMRNKSRGFLNHAGYPCFSMELQFERQPLRVIPRSEDYFLDTRFAFYRESCYNCKFKGPGYGSDLTLGDFCGLNLIDGEQEDGQGTTCVLVHSLKGRQLLESCKGTIHIRAYQPDVAVSYNPMADRSMGRLGYGEYLRNIFPESSIERLYYETKSLSEFNLHEQSQRRLWIERKRSELYIKLIRFQEYCLVLEDIPVIQGRIVIYGAGKLGRLLSKCAAIPDIWFIDRAVEIHSCNGFPVYHPGDRCFERTFKSIRQKVTMIVTPVWDFWEVKEQMRGYLPMADIISLEEVVEHIHEPI